MKKLLTDVTAGDALLEAMQESGITYIFSNLGSDHPSLIEGLAKGKEEGSRLPSVVIAPHEFVALSAAHGYYLLSSKAQGVFIHTDVGTQNLGGAVHNVFRSRVPVFIFAGETPSTTEEELPGSRNAHINYLQDVYDQRAIVKDYVKWHYDIRTGRNIKKIVSRAMQLATSEPKGPVYLTGTREVLEETLKESKGPVKWSAAKQSALSEKEAGEIAALLLEAEHPVVITSYMGRNPNSVEELVTFCETLAIPVVEANPSYMNFPTNHPLHLGFNSHELIDQADVILVIDSDVPWVPSIKQPKEDCRIIHVDTDPLKDNIPLWDFPVDYSFQADSYDVLWQLNRMIDSLPQKKQRIKERFQSIQSLHLAQRAEWRNKERMEDPDVITPEWLTACVRDVIDEDAILLSETITNMAVVSQHIPRNRPGTWFANGGTSLGWSGGAAIGAKLAQPDQTVVTLTGDGTYLFSVPSSVHWMSRRYSAPFLTVIYNNQGWNATKQNLLKRYPDGAAKRGNQYWVQFEQPADLSKIAEAAGGALAIRVSDPQKLPSALKEGMEAVKAGRSAVIDVMIPSV